MNRRDHDRVISDGTGPSPHTRPQSWPHRAPLSPAWLIQTHTAYRGPQTPSAQRCPFLGALTSLTPPGKWLFIIQGFHQYPLPRKPSLTSLSTAHPLGSHCILDVCWTCPRLWFLASAQTSLPITPAQQAPWNPKEGLLESACNVLCLPPGGSIPPRKPLEEAWGHQQGERREREGRGGQRRGGERQS